MIGAGAQAAIAAAGAPPETHRSLGIVLDRQGEKEKARAEYETYLERAPEAEDRDMIRMMMEQTR